MRNARRRAQGKTSNQLTERALWRLIHELHIPASFVCRKHMLSKHFLVLASAAALVAWGGVGWP